MPVGYVEEGVNGPDPSLGPRHVHGLRTISFLVVAFLHVRKELGEGPL